MSGEIAKAYVVDEHVLINQADAVWNDPTVSMCNNYIIYMNTVTQTILDVNDSRVCTECNLFHCNRIMCYRDMSIAKQTDTYGPYYTVSLRIRTMDLLT